MGCADYRLYCDGDSDSDGNDLLHGVLDMKKRSGVDTGCLERICRGYLLYNIFHTPPVKSVKPHVCFTWGFFFFSTRDATTVANFRLVVTIRPYLSLQLRAKSWEKVGMG